MKYIDEWLKLLDLTISGDHWVKLKVNQGWKNTRDNTLHCDQWDVSDRTGKKTKEIDFYGKQIWPCGTKKTKDLKQLLLMLNIMIPKTENYWLLTLMS